MDINEVHHTATFVKTQVPKSHALGTENNAILIEDNKERDKLLSIASWGNDVLKIMGHIQMTFTVPGVSSYK